MLQNRTTSINPKLKISFTQWIVTCHHVRLNVVCINSTNNNFINLENFELQK